MAKNLWNRLNELLGKFHDDHSSKTGQMFIRSSFPFTVQFGDKPADAFCFKVVNKSSTIGGESLHNVLISRQPDTGMLTMWCGDTKVVRADGEKEHRCNFWGKFKSSNGDFICKHIFFVLNTMDRKKIEEALAGTSSFSSGVEGIPLALKLGKNLLLYGPTGCGKTHLVREELKRHDRQVFRIHITNGLEDVDVLQKLLPDPQGKSWTRIEGELRQAFVAAKSGKVAVVLEELTRSAKSLRNLLIKAMDCEDGVYTLHDITNGELITVPRGNLQYLATANLGYADTQALDPALARRFSLCMFQDYDMKKEQEILEGKIGKGACEKMLKVTKAIRTQYQQGRLPNPLDTGSLIEWAELIESSVDFQKAAELTWLFRVVEKDSLGYPEPGQVSAIMEILEAA